jgi:hypothetical protein
MALISRLRRTPSAPGSSGVAKAHPIPLADDSSLWVAFVWGSLLGLLGWGLVLRMLLVPR